MKKSENLDLSKISWMKVGGKAKLFISVDSISELIQVFNEYPNEKIITLGAMSNVIISDDGFNGIVLKLEGDFKKNVISNINDETAVITTGCGVSSKDLSKFAMNSSLSGLEFLYTIPGTIGGNIKMNAGCYGSEIKDIIFDLTYFDVIKKEIVTKKAEELCFQYRKIVLDGNFVFLFASFACHKKNVDLIKNTMNEMNDKRVNSQPQGVKTCGSTFKNPQNIKAWELIDRSGLRGFSLGNAAMSDKHCNFMINSGNATANEMIELGNKVIDIVFKKTGTKLEWEIDIIDNKKQNNC